MCYQYFFILQATSKLSLGIDPLEFDTEEIREVLGFVYIFKNGNESVISLLIGEVP